MPKNRLVPRILVVIVILLVGFALQWLSFKIYPNTLVNHPLSIKYNYGFLTFTRVVYYGNGVVLSSPPQLDYLQLAFLIAVIYFIVETVGGKK
jgi:hypothetical protein